MSSNVFHTLTYCKCAKYVQVKVKHNILSVYVLSIKQWNKKPIYDIKNGGVWNWQPVFALRIKQAKQLGLSCVQKATNVCADCLCFGKPFHTCRPVTTKLSGPSAVFHFVTARSVAARAKRKTRGCNGSMPIHGFEWACAELEDDSHSDD